MVVRVVFEGGGDLSDGVGPGVVHRLGLLDCSGVRVGLRPAVAAAGAAGGEAVSAAFNDEVVFDIWTAWSCNSPGCHRRGDSRARRTG